MRPALLLAGLGLLLPAPGAAAGEGAPPAIERFTLENGLRVALRPVAGAKEAAVVVLYDFGENADFEGESGLAHLCEHLYCTAAAGATKARTVADIVRAYPGGWNFQTGWDCTVFATVVPAGGLDAELKDAAARMGSLDATQPDLDREVPRLLEEIGNMFGGMPALAAPNWTKEKLRGRAPWSPIVRFGGNPDDVRSIEVGTAQATLGERYRASNARLVVAGAFDLPAARKRIEETFGPLPRGKAPILVPGPRGPFRSPAAAAGVQVLPGGEDRLGQGPHACVGWRAPRPSDGEAYADFLVLAARVMTRSARTPKEPRERERVRFAPLDDPEFLLVSAGVGAEEKPADAVARLEKFVRDIVDAPFRPGEGTFARNVFSLFLDTMPAADAMLAGNPYLAAFALGRRDQLGADGPALAKALDAVTAESLEKTRAAWLADRAAVVVVPGEGK